MVDEQVGTDVSADNGHFLIRPFAAPVTPGCLNSIDDDGDVPSAAAASAS